MDFMESVINKFTSPMNNDVLKIKILPIKIFTRKIQKPFSKANLDIDISVT